MDCDALRAPSIWLKVLSSFTQTFFASPPTWLIIHKPESTEGFRNCTTVVVPVDSANALGTIFLRQLPNRDWWDWGRHEPRVYLVDYLLRGKGIGCFTAAFVSGG